MKRARFFEWISGPEAGKVEMLKGIYEDEGEYFYIFESGEKCHESFISRVTINKEDLRDKAMVEVNNKTNLWTFNTVKSRTYRDETTGQTYEIPPIQDIEQVQGQGGEVSRSSVGSINVIPPSKQQKFIELPSYEDYACDEDGHLYSEKKPDTAPKQPVSEPIVDKPEQVPTVTPKTPEKPVLSSLEETVGDDYINNISEPAQAVQSNTSVKVRPFTVHEKTPVELLIDKCKKHTTDISLGISVDLPGKSVFDIAKDEFGADPKEFVNYVVSNIDIQSIVDSLADALIDAYNPKSVSENG